MLPKRQESWQHAPMNTRVSHLLLRKHAFRQRRGWKLPSGLKAAAYAIKTSKVRTDAGVETDALQERQR